MIPTRYAKFVMALLGGVSAWGVTAAPDGYDQPELWGLLAVIATAIGVFAVPNSRPDGEPDDPTISEREPIPGDH